MRALIVYPRMYVYGGAELLVVRLANGLAAQGVHTGLLSTHVLDEVHEALSATEVIEPAPAVQAMLRRAPSLVGDAVYLAGAVRRLAARFDVINAHNLPAELVAGCTRRPVVWMCNEPPQVELAGRGEGLLRRSLYRTVLAADRWVVRRRMAEVVVADEFNRQRFERLYGVSPCVIPYGIDCDTTMPRRAAAARGDRPFTLLHVGMITPLKNQLASVEALAAIRPRIPDARLVIAGFGDGAYLAELEARVQELGLETQVEITGHLPRAAVRELFARGDVLVHPIRSQGGWLTPFEAICAGLPVIVGPQMTAAKLIADHDLGMVSDDLPSALQALYADPEPARRKAARRARWVRDNLSWRRFAERMAEVFAAAVDGG